jgi:hypothetical protein
MANGNTSARVVNAPAAKATGYGVAAAVGAAARALGEAGADAAAGLSGLAGVSVQLAHAAAASPAPDWLSKARTLWSGFAGADKALAGVVLADMAWYCDYAPRTYGKPAIAGIKDVGYAAWTNSSSLILVAEGLMKATGKVPELLLRHEAVHIHQFREKNADRPPATYRKMAEFELEAYRPTLAALDDLVDAGQTDYDEWDKEIDAVVTALNNLTQQTKLNDAQVKAQLLAYTYENSPSPMLPKDSGPTPANLYVP